MAQNHNLNHLAIIMDGNRRWAKKRGLPSLEGHRRGYEKMKQVSRWCIERGIKVFTVYAFSSENWNRSKREVSYLMNLFRRALNNDIDELNQQGARLVVIGQRNRLAPDIKKLIRQTEAQTNGNKKLLFQLAISYGGRPEITTAIQAIIKKKIPAGKVTERLISQHLWTAGVPDPDVVMRTSGEQRLSNFLPWQSVYAELIFIKKHWPAFTARDLDAVIEEFTQRQRRFGK